MTSVQSVREDALRSSLQRINPLSLPTNKRAAPPPRAPEFQPRMSFSQADPTPDTVPFLIGLVVLALGVVGPIVLFAARNRATAAYVRT